MTVKKIEELAGVARIGFERLWRHALFSAEIAEPAGDFGGNVGGDCGLRQGPSSFEARGVYRRPRFARQSRRASKDGGCQRRYYIRFLHPSLSSRNRPDKPHGNAHCRRPGAGGARPDLFVPGAGRDRACPRRSGRGAARRARGMHGRGLGRQSGAQSAPAQPHERRDGQARRAAAEKRAAQLRRLGRRLYAQPPRHGAAHGAAHGRASRPRPRTHRRAPRRAPSSENDAGARAGAAPVRRWADARQGRRRARGRRLRRRDRRADRRGCAHDTRVAAGAGGAAARCRFPQARFRADAACRGGCATHRRRSGRRHGDAARRRHRLGENRSLFRGGRGKYPQGAADADPDAGDRAHRAIARPLQRTLRCPPRGMALAGFSAQARAHLGGGGGE